MAKIFNEKLNQSKNVHNLPIFSNSLTMINILTFVVQENNAKKQYIFNRIHDVIKYIDFNEFKKASTKTAYVVMVSLYTIVQKRINFDLTKAAFIANEISITLPSDDKEMNIEFKKVVLPILQADNVHSSSVMEESYLMELLEKTIPFIDVIQYGSKLIEQYDNVYTSGPNNYIENVNRFISLVKSAHDKMQVYTSNDIQSYTLRDKESFKELVNETYVDSISPKLILRSGSQALNAMLSPQGGFIPGLYLFYSKSKSFKSALLEWLAITMSMYNEDKFEEEILNGITPTICFISLENHVYQDISRMHVMMTGRQIYQVENSTEAYNNMKMGKIDIKMIYCTKPDITPDWIEREYQKMIEIEGRKPVAFVIDYLRKMGDDTYGSGADELRLKLGALTNKLAILAQNTLRLPIISAHHLNRSADAIIADETLKGNHNIVKNLNQSLVSESKLIDDYVNFSAFTLPEEYDGQKYLTFLKGSVRGENTNVDYFAHPIDNGIQLVCDIEKPFTDSRAYIQDPTPVVVPKNTYPEIMKQFGKKPTFKREIRKNIEPTERIKNFKYGKSNSQLTFKKDQISIKKCETFAFYLPNS